MMTRATTRTTYGHARSLALLALTACAPRQPHAVVTVDDEDSVAMSATALSITTAPDARVTLVDIADKQFPLTFLLTWTGPAPDAATTVIEARDANGMVIARASPSALRDGGNAFVRLSRACSIADDCGAGGLACYGASACLALGACQRGSCLPDVCGISGVQLGNPCYVVSDTPPVPTGVCIASACSLSRCGDGITDPGAHELCDDGNGAAGDGCDAACRSETGWTCSTSPDVPRGPASCSPFCGDSLIVGTETCDDANANACDGCANCTAIAAYRCGDSYVCTGSQGIQESCDSGAANSDASCDGCCRNDCQPQRCGDGIVDHVATNPARDEQCDAGADVACAVPGCACVGCKASGELWLAGTNADGMPGLLRVDFAPDVIASTMTLYYTEQDEECPVPCSVESHSDPANASAVNTVISARSAQTRVAAGYGQHLLSYVTGGNPSAQSLYVVDLAAASSPTRLARSSDFTDGIVPAHYAITTGPSTIAVNFVDEARLFTTAGALVATIATVSAPNGSETTPQIAMTPDGAFAVTWADTPSQSRSIHVLCFDASHNAVGFQNVGSVATANHAIIAVPRDDDGVYGYVAATIDASKTLQVAHVRADTCGRDARIDIAIASDVRLAIADASFAGGTESVAIVWLDDGEGVHAAFADKAFFLTAGPLLVNPSENASALGGVAFTDDGLAVSYAGAITHGVYVQRVSPTGALGRAAWPAQ